MRAFSKMLLTLFVIFTSIAFGLYVYPSQPAIIWGMLAFLWVCYRLHRRAAALFDGTAKTAPARAARKHG